MADANSVSDTNKEETTPELVPEVKVSNIFYRFLLKCFTSRLHFFLRRLTLQKAAKQSQTARRRPA
jgi:hypothetical protein